MTRVSLTHLVVHDELVLAVDESSLGNALQDVLLLRLALLLQVLQLVATCGEQLAVAGGLVLCQVVLKNWPLTSSTACQ